MCIRDRREPGALRHAGVGEERVRRVPRGVRPEPDAILAVHYADSQQRLVPVEVLDSPVDGRATAGDEQHGGCLLYTSRCV